jgi:hypothetical protein
MVNQRRTNSATIFPMPASRCRVTYTDSEGSHSVEVHAETLYEAAAMAVAEFKQDQTVPHPPEPATELTVAVFRPLGVSPLCFRNMQGRREGKDPLDEFFQDPRIIEYISIEPRAAIPRIVEPHQIRTMNPLICQYVDKVISIEFFVMI